MIIIKHGDILQAKENIICHQVNVQGIMGGGLAKQIANTYPDVERKYQQYCKECNYGELMIGDYQAISVGSHKYIINCFTQKPNFDTDYEAIKRVFSGLLESCKKNGLSLAVPYGYGSNIANGSWSKISQIFDELSDEYNVPIVVYRLERENEKI